MKDLLIILTYTVLASATVYERLAFGKASAFLIIPSLILIPFVMFSINDIIYRYKQRVKKFK